MKSIWLDLPGKDMTIDNRTRLKINQRQFTGIVEVFYETTAKTFDKDNKTFYYPVLRKVAEIAPTGKVSGADLGDILAEHYSFSGYKGKANFLLGTDSIEIQALLTPYAIGGFLQLPEWLIRSTDVSVYINGNLALQHKF